MHSIVVFVVRLSLVAVLLDLYCPCCRIIVSNAFIIVPSTTNIIFQGRRIDRSMVLPMKGKDDRDSIDREFTTPWTVTTSASTSTSTSTSTQQQQLLSRRNVLQYSAIGVTAAFTSATVVGVTTSFPSKVNAVGPIKIALEPITYKAVLCPPDKPIPGEKAMVGMRGLCVTVKAKMDSKSPKDLEKVGVYGFVTDDETGDSVLANNPDGGTDAGQFAMIESISPSDTTISFEFIAAVPRDKDISVYENGIGPLNFSSLRIISYPGGQQFGAISPCEMNEFSDECEAWESINGPYEKADFMVKSNPRTKGY